MKLSPFAFKELIDGMPLDFAPGLKVFLPTSSDREGVIPAPPPAPPTFSEEELKAAERDGYKKGFIEGQKEGHTQAQSEQAETDRKLLMLAEKFAAAVEPLVKDYRRIALKINEEMPKAALAIARKVAGDALAENAPTVVNDIAVRFCEALVDETKITITVSESLGDALEKKLEQIAAKLPAATDIVVQHDPQMPMSDCRIEWKSGSIERSTEKLWQQLQQVTNNMTQTAVRDTAEHLDTLEKTIPPAEPTN